MAFNKLPIGDDTLQRRLRLIAIQSISEAQFTPSSPETLDGVVFTYTNKANFESQLITNLAQYLIQNTEWNGLADEFSQVAIVNKWVAQTGIAIANIARRDVANTFVSPQTFSNGFTLGEISSSAFIFADNNFGTGTSIPSDPDNITKSGFYSASSVTDGTTVVPSPYVIHINWANASNFSLQFMQPQSGGQLYKRTRVNGTWSSLEVVGVNYPTASQMDIGSASVSGSGTTLVTAKRYPANGNATEDGLLRSVSQIINFFDTSGIGHIKITIDGTVIYDASGASVSSGSTDSGKNGVQIISNPIKFSSFVLIEHYIDSNVITARTFWDIQTSL